MTEVIIGSRESKLAVLQSEMVKSYIEQKNREENAGSGSTSTSLGSSRFEKARSGSSFGTSIGISLRLCTDRLLLPSSNALSSSFTNNPFQSVRIQEMYWCFLREWRSWIRINLWDVPA